MKPRLGLIITVPPVMAVADINTPSCINPAVISIMAVRVPIGIMAVGAPIGIMPIVWTVASIISIRIAIIAIIWIAGSCAQRTKREQAERCPCHRRACAPTITITIPWPPLNTLHLRGGRDNIRIRDAHRARRNRRRGNKHHGT